MFLVWYLTGQSISAVLVLGPSGVLNAVGWFLLTLAVGYPLWSVVHVLRQSRAEHDRFRPADADERFVYYYAHLLSRAPGLAEGQAVRRGDVIGAVGQTGNAPVPHLHFEIQRLGPARHWWEAEAMNPYPLLVSGRAPT